MLPVLLLLVSRKDVLMGGSRKDWEIPRVVSMTRMQACPKMPLTMGSEVELARRTKGIREEGRKTDDQDATVTVPTIWRHYEGAT